MTEQVFFQRLAFVGGVLPRKCRTAEFTTQLFSAVSHEGTGTDCLLVALGEGGKQVRYPSSVRYEIDQENLPSYQQAAEFLNHSSVDITTIIFESEVFGGPAGSYSLSFVNMLHSAVVAILPHIPEDPDVLLLQVMHELGMRAVRVIVSSAEQQDLLQRQYRIAEDKIDVIPFGSPGGNWSESVEALLSSFRRARAEPSRHSAQLMIPATGEEAEDPYPPIKLDYFLRLTDETGIFHRSLFSLPDYHAGYKLHDNACALIFSLLLEHTGKGPFFNVEVLASRFLAFLWYAFDEETAQFRDHLSFSRQWQEGLASEEHQATALWALGIAVGRAADPNLGEAAFRLIERAISSAREFSSPAAWACAVIGCSEYLRRYPGDRRVSQIGRLLVNRLMQESEGKVEDLDGYQARTPQALIMAGRWSEKPGVIEVGLSQLKKLVDSATLDRQTFLSPGEGAVSRQGREMVSQQCLAVSGIISACLEAYRMTQEENWVHTARRAYEWFLGANRLGLPLYFPDSGACADGLLSDRIDDGRSAEALLSFLMAQVEIRLLDQLAALRSSPRGSLSVIQIGLMGGGS